MHPTKRFRNIALLSVALAAYLLLLQVLLSQIPAFASATATLRERLGGALPSVGIIIACVAFAAATVLAVETRNVRTMKGGVAVGLLTTVVGLSASIAFGLANGDAAFVAIRSSLLAAGFIALAMGAVALRR